MPQGQIEARDAARRQQRPASPVSQNFRLVFFSVLGLTLLSMAVSIVLVLAVREPSEQVKAVLQVALTIWQVGAGAIIGLLGGKALQ